MYGVPVASGASLIDQALAANKAGEPVQLGQSVEFTPAQGLVYAIYEAVAAKRRGWPGSDDATVERYVRTARRAGIPEHEIEAAIAAGEQTEDEPDNSDD